MLEGLLKRVDEVLVRVNPGVDRQWTTAPSEADWTALFEALPEARGEELETWFAWHNGQAPGASLILRGIGPFHGLRDQGRLLSLDEALAVRAELVRRDDGERFVHALPLVELPDMWRDDDGARRYLVYQVRGREAGNLVHTLTLTRPDVWPVADRRGADGTSALMRWAKSVIEMERACFGPFDQKEMAQRWVLAAPVVRALWFGDTGRFGYGPRARARSRDAVVVLRRDWDIRDAIELREMLNERLGTTPDAGQAAFHWGTLGAVAEWGYQAYYLSAEEAWNTAVHAAQKLQATFGSWREYVTAYQAWREGRHEQGPDDPAFGGDTLSVMGLLEDPRFTWHNVPWETPLPADLSMPETHDSSDFRVKSADELQRALLEAEPGDVIRLAAGRYSGVFFPADSGLTLIGDDGVVLESSSDEPVLTTYHGIALKNIELRASGSVVVNCGTFLRMENCRIIGGDDGLTSFGDEDVPRNDFEVQLIDCVIDSSGDRGVVIEDGFVSLLRTRILNTGGHALTVRARAQGLHAKDCAILDAGDAAVRAFGAQDVTLNHVTIERAASIGILLAKGACAELSGTAIANCGGRGVLVKEDAELLAHRCRIENSVGANVDIGDSGSVAVFDSEILGGQWGGVYLHPALGAVFARCRITGARLACLFVDGGDAEPSGTAPHIAACTLGQSMEGSGIYAARGARLRTTGTTIRDTPGIAVEVASSTLEADTLCIEDCAGGVIAHGGATLHLRDAAVLGGGGSGVIVDASTGLIDGLRVRGGLRGLTVGHEGQVVATKCAFSGIHGAGSDAEDEARGFAILLGEASSLVLLGGSIIADGNDDAVHVMNGAKLVAKGLTVLGGEMCGLRISGAQLHLVDGSVTGSKSAGVLLRDGATASLLRTELAGQAFSAVEVCEDATLLIRDAQLKAGPGESAVFAHTGGRVVVQGADFQQTVRAIAAEDGGVVEQLPAQPTGLSGLLADLVAAVAGPQLADAEDALAKWTATTAANPS